MSGYSVTIGRGNVRANENDYLFKPIVQRPAGKYGVVLCHGYGEADEWIDPTTPGSLQIPAWLARAGIPCIGAEMSGNAFAFDTALTDIDNAITSLSTRAGVPSTKVCLLGVSMGGATAVRYAQLYPGKVAAVAGIIPLTDLVYLYTNNIGGLGPEIATAWGVTYPAALPSAADIQAGAAAMTVPTRLYYSSTDATVTPSRTTAFAAANPSKMTAIDIGTHGHTDTSVKDAVNYSGSQLGDIIDFFKANGA